MFEDHIHRVPVTHAPLRCVDDNACLHACIKVKADVRTVTFIAGNSQAGLMDATGTCMEKLPSRCFSLVELLTLFTASVFKDQWPAI